MQPFDFNQASEKINREISLLAFDRQPSELYSPVKYFLGLGGKRIRPLLSLLGCYLFDDNYEKALRPSLAVELFHNFTLIHDDIMDQAPLRRGFPTVHEKWNASIALLAGDVTLIEAYDLLENISPDIRKEIFALFNLTARQVCEGQQFDMNFEKQENVSLQAYTEMITLKTAVLLGFSMYMGARIGGASIEGAQKLYDAALNMGISFQIKDDFLDVYGDASKFGKFTGGDIVANKKTFLLLSAIENASELQLAQLKQLMNDACVDKEAKVQLVVQIYNQLNIKQLTTEAIQKYFALAMEKLGAISANEEKKEFLKQYFTALLERES